MRKLVLSAALIGFLLLFNFAYTSPVRADTWWTGSGNNSWAANSGNVGIGTTNPLDQLHIYESGTGAAWRGRGVFSGQTSAVVAGEYDGKAVIGGHGADLGSWQPLLINPGGSNVGIGTFIPQGALQVNGTRQGASNQGQLLVAGIEDHAYIQIQSTSPTSKETGLQFVGQGTIQTPDWAIRELANTSNLQFTYGGSSNFMTLANSGNIGIGTTTPAGTLQINGTRQGGSNQGQLLVVGNNDHAYIQVLSTNPSYKETGLQIAGAGGVGTPDWTIKEGAGVSNLSFNYWNNDSVLTLTSGGKIGIGATSPQTDSKLHVYESGSSTNTWKGRGVFSGQNVAVVLGEGSSKAMIGGFNSALNTWNDLILNSGGGNIGIGTTSPSEKLDVDGNIKLNGNIIPTGTICIGSCD